MPQIAYLGPRGTFTEQATRALTNNFNAELVPTETVPLALDAVRSGDVLGAGVPVENSIEGSVSATLDALTYDEPLIAVAETVLPVEFHLVVREGTEAEKITSVASHPHAIAQVRAWLSQNLPEAEIRATSSTSAAAAAVEAGEIDAAVTSPIAIQHYRGLETLATDIADNPDALTRFLLVRRPGVLPEPTGADRTSVAAVMPDEVGALTTLLSELSLREINLTRIESRPIKRRFGEYRFYLDFDGHVADTRIGDALMSLRRRCSEVLFLGSYPKADRVPAAIRPASSEQAFQESAQWLAKIRLGRLA